jgi:two-component system NarL family response regulator
MQDSARNASDRRVKVLVADDHPVVRAGLVAFLEREADLQVVCEAGNGAEAVDGWLTHGPDVGLIDLRMPGLDGFGAVAAIRSQAHAARLVVMTTLCGSEDVYRALQVGASGYLLKDCGPAELVACVRAVAAGRKYLQPQAAASLAERIASDELTPREAEVLHWLAEGLSNKAIGRRMGVAEGTVKTHLKALFFKLQVESRTQAARLALSQGLVRLPPGASLPIVV